MPLPATLETHLPSLPLRRGKVRDVYDLGETLLLVATDRISAFDWVLPNGIPDKGKILTQLSQFWFEQLDVPHHVITCDVEAMPLAAADRRQLAGRAMLVRKTQVVPIECVARGYLSGSGWKEYLRQGTVCDLTLPAGLRESDRLSGPIFTPATKATSGHDENISFEAVCGAVGAELAAELRRRTLEVYRRGADYAVERGIIIADTKFEWGIVREPAGERRLILIDEVFTPDSSRFWPADQYRPGRGQASFDKQFVRDWLESVGWDKQSPPPRLPDEVVERTREKYLEAYQILTGRQPEL
ncbi:MAG TPA: phosphoribosylaminoimidazolesuccinocarboxamide synthase [Pirellulales bacterium]|nr:phosphoribosylaminoimidazolesuccinocarboxamide synthase [Pirellulales bacterium]